MKKYLGFTLEEWKDIALFFLCVGLFWLILYSLTAKWVWY